MDSLRVVSKVLGIFAMGAGVAALIVFSNQPRVQREDHACRLPDVATEYRVIFQIRDGLGIIKETCSIEPRDQDEGRYETMQRLLKRERHKS